MFHPRSVSLRGVLSLCAALVTSYLASAQAWTPPPRPAIPPVIAKVYPGDTNRDRIDDRLTGKVETAVAAQRAAVTTQQKTSASASIEGMVDVELIFDDQVTQKQINDFLAQGGQITHMFEAVSYGWNAKIPLGKVTSIPALMGPRLVLVEEAAPAQLHLDLATRTGRVRPVWAGGFAGNASGYDGDTSITIAVCDTGIDETHTDLAGRKAFWQDYTTDALANPADRGQHGSHVAGIALGTGAASGVATSTLSFSDEGSLSGVGAGSFFPSPISLPTVATNVTIVARWNGGGSTTLYLASHPKGTDGGYTADAIATGTSPLTLNAIITGNASRAYTPALTSNGAMTDFTVTTTVPNYPAVGDGFNKERGVAPGCRWAGAKVFTDAGSGDTGTIGAGVDGIVANRVANNIKVMNLSLGVNGTPGVNGTIRQKINSAVNAGIVVVVSAGNDGQETTAPAREVDDPGRAALAITVGAANDNNQLTEYTSQGFLSPVSTPGQEEDFKPDLMAPGGSQSYYTSILSVDSNTGDGVAFADQVANNQLNIQGTSMASPFVAGSAALVVDALQQSGTAWSFASSQQPRYVKMLLCATSTESNATRESNVNNPTLERAAAGPSGYPVGKDLYEGYGLINPDAAVEAVALTYALGTSANATLGPTVTDRRAWARTVNLSAGSTFTPLLAVPAGADFDLYLYSTTPTAYGAPVLLASSTSATAGGSETFSYNAPSATSAVLVVKRVSGSGSFTLTSGSPPIVTVPPASLNYNENQGITTVASTLTLTDSDSPNIVSASVAITAGLNSIEDTLFMAPNPQNGISATYTSATGILQLTGTSSVANYQAALRSVSYFNSSDNPSTATRTITFAASDGSSTGTASRNITVVSINDAPTLNAISDPASILEDAGTQTVNLSGITPGGAESQTLTVTAVSNNPGLIPNPTVNYTSPLDTGSLTYTPTAGLSGSAIITVTVQDNGGTANGGVNTTSRTFTVNVLDVNDAPTLAAISDPLAILEDASLQTVNLSGITTGGESQTLTVTAVSNNTALIPNPTVTYTSPNTVGSLSYTPVANASGSAVITVTVQDSGSTANGGINTAVRTFTVNVTDINDAPTLAAISNPAAILEDAALQTINLSGIATGGSESQTLTVTATSDNTALIPNPTVTYTSPNTVGSLSYTPAANASGSAVITVTVQDNGGTANGGINTATRAFTVNVTPVNDPPTLAVIANPPGITVNAPQQTVNLSGIAAGASESQTLTVTAVSDNTGLIPNPTISYTSPAAIGSLSYTPVLNAAGTAIITVTVQDNGGTANGGVNSVSRTFTVNVVANNPPTLNAIADPTTILEDAATQTINFAGITTGGESGQTLVVTATSDNPGLIPNPSVTYTSPNATGSLSFTPVANASGTAVITVTVNDGQLANNLATRTFTVNVTPVNDAPVIAAIADPAAILEDAPLQTINFSGASAGPGESQLVSVSATSSNPALIPNPTVTYTSPNATGSLSYTPVANASGSATITVTVQDDGGTANGGANTTTRTFSVNVTAVNDAPTLASIADPAAILEDAAAQTINLSGIAAGSGETQTLTVTATSSNPGLIPNPNVTYTSPNATGSLSYTPVANASGSATITVTVQDNGGTANGGINTTTRTFVINVTPVNDAPTLASIADPAAILEDAAAQTINLTGVAAGNGETQALTVTATSSNPGLIPNPNVTYTSPNATGSLTYTPVANTSGSATITVTVQDDGGTANGGINTTTRTFVVNVTPVNDTPTLASITDPAAILEDAAAQTVNLSGVAAGSGETQALTVTATSSNPSLIPNPNVTYTSPGATGSLSYTPVANTSGIAVITVTVQDDGGTANGGVNTITRTFTVNVTPVNDAPTLASIVDPAAIPEDAAAQTINLSGIAAGSGETQALTVTVVSSNPGLIPNPSVTYTSPNAIGSLSYTPVANTSGTAVITVTVQDDGGTANGGVNTTTRTFTVNVSELNDAPTLASIPNPAALDEDAPAQVVALAGITAGPNESQALTVTAQSSDPALIPNPVVTYSSPGATGSLSFTPAADAFGEVTITVTVDDGQATDNTVTRSFTITLNPVNDAPSFTPGTNITVSKSDPAQTVATWATAISAGPANESSQALSFTVTNDNNALFSTQPAIASNGTLTFTPALDTIGTATVTVVLHDDGGTDRGGVDATSAQTFTITIQDKNFAPSFIAGADVVVPLNAPAYTENGWATAIKSGPASESSQTVTFLIENDNTAIFTTQPAISPTGTLTFTPAPGASGLANITVRIQDDGGTLNGGVDTSAAQTFRIAVATYDEELGTYNGLIRPATGAPMEQARLGLVRIKFAKKGAFTAKLSLGKAKYTLKGSVQFAGGADFGKKKKRTATATLKRKGQSPLTLDFDLDTAFGSDQLAGTITDNGTPFADIVADRALYTSKRNPKPPFTAPPAALLGKYTAAFPARTPAQLGLPASSFPQGDGFAFVTVSKKGDVRLVGTLADGAKFSYSNSLSKTNELPLHFLADKGRDTVNGTVSLRTVPGVSDIDATGLDWLRTADNRAKLYPTGWTDGIPLDLVGAKYSRPRGTDAIPWLSPADTDGNATLSFFDAGLTSPLAAQLNIDPRGKAKPVSSTINKLKVTVSGKSGALKGTFIHPTTGKKTSFSGILLDPQQLGVGFFTSGTESGAVTLQSSP